MPSISLRSHPNLNISFIACPSAVYFGQCDACITALPYHLRYVMSDNYLPPHNLETYRRKECRNLSQMFPNTPQSILRFNIFSQGIRIEAFKIFWFLWVFFCLNDHASDVDKMADKYGLSTPQCRHLTRGELKVEAIINIRRE